MTQEKDPYLLTNQQLLEYFERIQLPSALITCIFTLEGENKKIKRNKTKTYLNLELLYQIHIHHTRHVPFENLSTTQQFPNVRKRETSPTGPLLNVQHVFDKIVSRNRGGYCFEMNTLLLAVLKSLGFNVMSGAAKVVQRPIYEDIGVEDGSGRQLMTPFAHMILFVTFPRSEKRIDGENIENKLNMDEKVNNLDLVHYVDDDHHHEVQEDVYLVDVGLGGRGLIEPILIQPVSETDDETRIGAYSIRNGHNGFRRDEDAHLKIQKRHRMSRGYYLQKRMPDRFLEDGSSRPDFVDLYFFRLQEFYPEDYQSFNFYISQFPNGLFSTSLICSIVTEDYGRWVLFDYKLKRKDRFHNDVQSVVLKDEKERIEALEKYFGLTVE